MDYDEEGRIEFGSPRDLEKPYDHREWLLSLRRQCPRCGTMGAMMRIMNVDACMELLPEPINGFIYKAWPVYRCSKHSYTTIL